MTNPASCIGQHKRLTLQPLRWISEGAGYWAANPVMACRLDPPFLYGKSYNFAHTGGYNVCVVRKIVQTVVHAASIGKRPQTMGNALLLHHQLKPTRGLR